MRKKHKSPEFNYNKCVFVSSLSKELGLFATPVGIEANNHERPTHAFTYLQITNQTVRRKSMFIPSVKNRNAGCVASLPPWHPSRKYVLSCNVLTGVNK
jgi:hypothetical protein